MTRAERARLPRVLRQVPRKVARRVRGLVLARRCANRPRRLRVEPMRLIRQGRGTRLVLGDGVGFFRGNRLVLQADGAELSIGEGTYLNWGCTVVARQRVEIGQWCAIAWNVSIMDSDFHRLDGAGPTTVPVRIGNFVWIGANVTILKGVTVGDGAVIAAGALVTEDVPAAALVAGVPARVVRTDVTWGSPTD